ncbi:MAG: histidinol-phosphatase HisJ family protein [Candidatus Aenigmatarchaeota archaeon]
MRLIDYHIHCNYSPDNKNKIRDVIEAVGKKNLLDACIIAHFEPSTFGKPSFFSRPNSITVDEISSYFKEVERCNLELGQNVRIGLEVEYDEKIEKHIGKVLDEYPFDFILGSCHFIDGHTISANAEAARQFFEKNEPKEAARRYFEKIRSAISSGLFDSMAHLDVVKKSATGFYGSFPFEIYSGYFKEISRLLVKHDTCFEVNTNPSGLGKQAMYPSIEGIRMLYAEGARAVTLGSDAHTIDRIGDRLPEVIQILKQVGFKEISTFECRTRKPVTISDLG